MLKNQGGREFIFPEADTYVPPVYVVSGAAVKSSEKPEKVESVNSQEDDSYLSPLVNAGVAVIGPIAAAGFKNFWNPWWGMEIYSDRIYNPLLESIRTHTPATPKKYILENLGFDPPPIKRIRLKENTNPSKDDPVVYIAHSASVDVCLEHAANYPGEVLGVFGIDGNDGYVNATPLLMLGAWVAHKDHHRAIKRQFGPASDYDPGAPDIVLAGSVRSGLVSAIGSLGIDLRNRNIQRLLLAPGGFNPSHPESTNRIQQIINNFNVEVLPTNHHEGHVDMVEHEDIIKKAAEFVLKMVEKARRIKAARMSGKVSRQETYFTPVVASG